MSLLGIEERQLHIKPEGNGGVDHHHSNYHIKRVLVNPGKKYRINIQSPVIEVTEKNTRILLRSKLMDHVVLPP